MKKLKDFEPLKPAEKKLYTACQIGEVAWIGKERPTEKTEQNEIRAEFIRFLALGGDKEDKSFEIDQKGIWINGAFVSGELDLWSCNINFPLCFTALTFNSVIALMDAQLKNLNLVGCSTKHITGDRLKCEGGVSLKKGFESNGEVRLLGAEIGGSLDCSGGKFTNKKGIALNCDSMEVGGYIFLNKGFEATGEVKLLGVTVGRSIECMQAKFINENNRAFSCDGAKINSDIFLANGFESNGEVRLLGAEIGGNLSCIDGKFKNKKGIALNCGNMEVGGSVFLIGSPIEGNLDLTSAKCKNLVDEKEFWTQEGLQNIYLDGFAYEHIYSNTLDAKSRIEWLNKMPKEYGFKPQPYKQLAKVLREMGHTDDADDIMVEYHDRRSKEFKSPLKITFFWLHRLYSRYGYKPLRGMAIIMFTAWFICSLLFWHGANKGVFAPSNPIVFQHEKYESNVSAVAFVELFNFNSETNNSKNWYFNDKLKGEYTTFQPFLYSLDVILPVVDLYMEKDWGVYIPTPTSPSSAIDLVSDLTLNHIVRFFVWLENIVGWILSFRLVAILSGYAKTEKE